MDEKYEKLCKPFPEEEIDWRVSQSGVTKEGKPWAIVLPYLNNRAIMDRLDEVFGWDGWNVEFFETPKGDGFLCRIAIMTDKGIISKMDGADKTDIEAIKGGISGSMKRAAVQLGIGRYLYRLNKTYYAEIVEDPKTVDRKQLHRDQIKGKNNKKDSKDQIFYWKAPKL